MHFSAGDVWDDIEEVCDDCGAKLDRQTLGTLSRMTTNPIHSPKSVFLWREALILFLRKENPRDHHSSIQRAPAGVRLGEVSCILSLQGCANYRSN